MEAVNSHIDKVQHAAAAATNVREAYCRKKGRGGGDAGLRAHVAVVVVLLHVACFAQYALCGLYWGFSRKARPDTAETALVVVGTAAPALAGLYMYFSPLGRKQRPSVHQEPEDHSASNEDSVVVDVVVAAAPEGGERRWAGGLLDVGDDPTACWLSCACTFCVFGWNMERLGLGSTPLHAVTFALLCVTPLWVLNIAATNIRDEDVAGAGVVLCVLGLIYGGFWRARLRRRYGLPGDGGGADCSSSLGDYVKWVFCWGCALAQEVRTGNQILLVDDVEAGGGVDSRREAGDGDADACALQPLPRESGVKLPCQAGASELATVVIADTHSVRGDESPLLRQQQSSSSSAGEMRPPVPPSMPEMNTSGS